MRNWQKNKGEAAESVERYTASPHTHQRLKGKGTLLLYTTFLLLSSVVRKSGIRLKPIAPVKFNGFNFVLSLDFRNVERDRYTEVIESEVMN